MTLYRLSIERPVLATVMSIVIMIFGWVSYQRLGEDLVLRGEPHWETP